MAEIKYISGKFFCLSLITKNQDKGWVTKKTEMPEIKINKISFETAKSRRSVIGCVGVVAISLFYATRNNGRI